MNSDEKKKLCRQTIGKKAWKLDLSNRTNGA